MNGPAGANNGNGNGQWFSTSATILWSSHEKLGSLQTVELIQEFGAGYATPGVGSFAAISGAYAGALVVNVARLTLRKPRYAAFHDRARSILVASEMIIGRLQRFAEEDSSAYKRVIQMRCKRDEAKDNPLQYERLRRIALQYQYEATLLPLSIAENCLIIAEYAFELFEKGFQSANSSAFGAVKGAISSVQTAVFTVVANLKPFTNEEWVKGCRLRAAKLILRAEVLEHEFTGRLRDALAPAICQ